MDRVNAAERGNPLLRSAVRCVQRRKRRFAESVTAAAAAVVHRGWHGQRSREQFRDTSTQWRRGFRRHREWQLHVSRDDHERRGLHRYRADPADRARADLRAHKRHRQRRRECHQRHGDLHRQSLSGARHVSRVSPAAASCCSITAATNLRSRPTAPSSSRPPCRKSGGAYAVTLPGQPVSPSQSCVITQGAGTVAVGRRDQRRRRLHHQYLSRARHARRSRRGRRHVLR